MSLKYEKLHATCGMEFLGMGNRAWGMGHGKEHTNAQCPKRRGDYPSTDTWGWSFPSLSMNQYLIELQR
ncbi:hypothetical protein HUN01_13375 [Nostoc edaphicum CCNP1411]|uniref:Uncharacterized protein n=1 Tax=Nostoc edaphicum CCNP1411 TaxID=1472755 RepID=A0A7D7LB54_9NOSO|nr:hypothetical protein [Nostoc edaphicum]QMS88538.1 hypothetical protein HUN01_13375 [Nostoc edaphicum CCNP1411]